MSKVAMPRPRYVAAILEAQTGGSPAAVSRNAFAEALQAAARSMGWQGSPPQLIRYAFPHAIVRVEHGQLAAAKAALAAIRQAGGAQVRVATVSTSGTLRALTSRTGVLQERGPRPQNAAKPAPGGPRTGERLAPSAPHKSEPRPQHLGPPNGRPAKA